MANRYKVTLTKTEREQLTEQVVSVKFRTFYYR